MVTICFLNNLLLLIGCVCWLRLRCSNRQAVASVGRKTLDLRRGTFRAALPQPHNVLKILGISQLPQEEGLLIQKCIGISIAKGNPLTPPRCQLYVFQIVIDGRHLGSVRRLQYDILGISIGIRTPTTAYSAPSGLAFPLTSSSTKLLNPFPHS